MYISLMEFIWWTPFLMMYMYIGITYEGIGNVLSVKKAFFFNEECSVVTGLPSILAFNIKLPVNIFHVITE